MRTPRDAGLVALLDEQSLAWPAADEEVAQLTSVPPQPTDEPLPPLDEVLSSVGDWLDPLDAILRGM
jgi:hypothetical protein